MQKSNEQPGKLEQVEEGCVQEMQKETNRATSRSVSVENCSEKHFTKLVERVGRFGWRFKEN